ncbi:M14 family metallopeptidase [Jeotgalibacillus sp. ET6]|uniref:M14 family metallopeptidase n=1 Tax=Jeotgalibacillus sp. ET6 TaxID=3037260 RepID=UPI0024185578|nr:M14 family metallopeptidase [Jeotgalibacillus sp. ET6]MDG5472328.1 M14 family metallopeptidase [Jeotgalibacillus sp. ET6]
MKAIDEYFPKTYEESREVFRKNFDIIKALWPNAELTSHSIGKEEDNTIDMIYAEGTETNERVLFMTSGEHGIEGYAGAAMLDVFVSELADLVDAKRTGICLIHALNPWGMKHFRRVTENNVDLNRNYLVDSSMPEDINKEYERLLKLFLPDGKIKSYIVEESEIRNHMSKGVVAEGYSGLMEAKGMGQFEFPTGVYYGGKEKEESAIFLSSIQRKLLSTFSKVIHMDWHTALGPTKEVTMVMSETDGRSEKELKKEYGLKNVKTFSPADVKGDSTNHFYEVKNLEFPQTRLFSALFEFGTFGTSMSATIREFLTITLENRLYHEGAEHEEDRQKILSEFKAMFYPDEHDWRMAVLTEGRNAIKGVFQAEGLYTIRG